MVHSQGENPQNQLILIQKLKYIVNKTDESMQAKKLSSPLLSGILSNMINKSKY